MRLARGLYRRDVRVLAYHRVLPSAEPSDFRFDLELISASAEAFREQLQTVKRKFAPMRFDEVADALERGRPIPRGAVLITFDDGYDDNYRIAYPILHDLGMSAMFFVSTGHIESGRPYAYDWLVYMLCVTASQRLQVPELGIDWALPEGLDERRSLASMLLDRIKTLDALAQQALIARLETEWGLPSSAGHPDCQPMTWNHLREMHRGGMEIGTHGAEHRMLAKLPEALMREEIFGSKRVLEQALGDRVQVMSYPVGGPDAYNGREIAAVREAGYRMACSYIAAPEALAADTRFEMRRLPIERKMDRDWFEAMLALPEVFCYRSRYRTG
ncbi:MAG: polysaccharide deacetylase [Lysobacteraceae bacterium]|nr:MAG: polysaccharide deacetylase [Xanthomonadaceae bacterium]